MASNIGDSTTQTYLEVLISLCATKLKGSHVKLHWQSCAECGDERLSLINTTEQYNGTWQGLETLIGSYGPSSPFLTVVQGSSTSRDKDRWYEVLVMQLTP